MRAESAGTPDHYRDVQRIIIQNLNQKMKLDHELSSVHISCLLNKVYLDSYW